MRRRKIKNWKKFYWRTGITLKSDNYVEISRHQLFKVLRDKNYCLDDEKSQSGRTSLATPVKIESARNNDLSWRRRQIQFLKD